MLRIAYFALRDPSYKTWTENWVTRWVYEKIAQNVAQPIFSKLILNLYLRKKYTQSLRLLL
jgi:hypothetical protein